MIRVGIVGAGENTRVRHIPGLRAIAGVEITGVVNSSAESTAKAAALHQIPRQFPSWEALVADSQIDAVVIGTWPDLHAPVTCAALAAGKHVLTEARMARDLEEARAMQAAAQAHPDRVAMVVPSPFGLTLGPRVQDLIHDGFLGTLREYVVLGVDDQFQDYTKPLHWRQDASKSGINTLTLGILHETAMRWLPPPKQVFAQSHIFEPQRWDPKRPQQVPVTVPDNVQILTQSADNVRGLYHFSGVNLFGPGKQIHMYGSSGTIKVIFAPDGEQLWVGRVGDSGLKQIDVPAERCGKWRVEEEFIAAIRGEEPVRLNSFDVGIAGMEFTEAVARSAATKQVVSLPQA
jgi:predicted dehydrogenase